MNRRTQRPGFVYRCYDSHGRLIYVGQSANVDQRMWTHRTQWLVEYVIHGGQVITYGCGICRGRGSAAASSFPVSAPAEAAEGCGEPVHLGGWPWRHQDDIPCPVYGSAASPDPAAGEAW